MTRTDVMASSRPQNVGAAPSGITLRALRALPIALLLALAVMLPSTAVAAEPGTSTYGYGQEPNKPSTATTPTTTPTTTTAPKTGTLPSKESEKPTTPTSATEPEKTSTTSPTTASTLPFTGFDLSWDIGFGVVLLGAGFSILAMQRRQRRHPQR
jgi:hypothetical protein